ncbi:GTP cyclohydrolase-2 [Thalassobaculum fulvum]|uniref:GTP cyclohydrolase-2 n=1 Tax=Thalassobaculum fulvum TaxID=1633335 RepID=A0A918XMZ6_9PROT|nr:GTP cyclohydrolase II [Thalassobaculum fulvum]GHD39603.1 GTP cyclohydrolase-2 [Thalassobaculum fulvum]
MPNDPSPAVTAPRPGDQLAVDRGVAELRRGGTVAVRGGPERDRLALAVAAEMITDEAVARLRVLAGSDPVLAITRNRAAALGSGGSAPVVSLTLPAGMPADRMAALADPTTGPVETRGLTTLPEPETGPAAAAVRLAKLARLLPATLVASVPDVPADRMEAWARDHALLLVDSDAIDTHRRAAAARLVRAAAARVPLADAEDCELIAFRPLDGGLEHVAIRIGSPDPDQPVLIRLHSACLTGDLLGSLRCDCGDQLRGAIRAIAEAGGGVLLYLAQEGRDIGLINKLKAYSLQDLGADTIDANTMLGYDDDERVYFPAAEMLEQLGIRRVRMMTNNPEKIGQLAACGVEVVERVRHVFPSNRHNERYLEAKARRSGHLF